MNEQLSLFPPEWKLSDWRKQTGLRWVRKCRALLAAKRKERKWQM